MTTVVYLTAWPPQTPLWPNAVLPSAHGVSKVPWNGLGSADAATGDDVMGPLRFVSKYVGVNAARLPISHATLPCMVTLSGLAGLPQYDWYVATPCSAPDARTIVWMCWNGCTPARCRRRRASRVTVGPREKATIENMRLG